MHYFKKYKLAPKLIVELESQRQLVMEYLELHGLNIDTLFIADECRDEEEISEYDQRKLLKRIRDHGITHAVISTEPKAHYAYLKFFISNRIHTLTDKPITSPLHVSTQAESAQRILEQYEHLAALYRQAKIDGVLCEVQCQRRWHQGYLYVRETLRACLEKFKIPITGIEIYHCDGMWNMPDEFLTRENHPYKYGYGKLFHSGYHFIDLMSWLLKLNFSLEEKAADHVEMYSMITRPDDFMEAINHQDYRRIFKTEKFTEVFNERANGRLSQFGEIDFYSLLQFTRKGKVMTTCSLNLLQNGFSRRAWTELPSDTYKSNGRVRHERANIQVGPLMNIQVHSYQSKQIQDRCWDKDNLTGSLEHFEIYIFRNTDIIGGKPFEKITIDDLSCPSNNELFIGFNEQSRETCLLEFLSGQNRHSDLLDHELSIKILSNAYKSICSRNSGGTPTVTFPLDEHLKCQ